MSPLSDAELRLLADIERHLDDPPAGPPGAGPLPVDPFPTDPFPAGPSGTGPASPALSGPALSGADVAGVDSTRPARRARGWGVPAPLVVGWIATCLVFFALVTGAPPLLLAAGAALLVPVGAAAYRLRHRRGRP